MRTTRMEKTEAMMIVWRGVAGLHAGEEAASQVAFRGKRVRGGEDAEYGRGGIVVQERYFVGFGIYSFLDPPYKIRDVFLSIEFLGCPVEDR
jgi:hypothetical protein